MEFQIHLTGDDGDIVNLNNSASAAVLTVPQAVETRIFRERALTQPRLWGNQLGLYQFVDMKGRSKINMSSFKTPEYNLRDRIEACQWDPDKGMDKYTDTMETHGVEYQGEMCNAEIFGKCWRQLLGPGNKINDITGSDGAVKLLSMAIDNVHRGIGNDIYLLLDFGGHPLIDLADEQGWWKLNKRMDTKKWDRLKRQQGILGGHVAIYEGLKADNIDQFNVEINPDDCVNGQYIGDTFELFDDIISTQSDKLDAYSGDKIISVSSSIFNRHKRLTKDRFGGLKEAYNIFKYGTDGESIALPVDPRFVMDYDGFYIYNRPEWNWLSKVTGCEVYMAALNAKGSLGVGYDVSLADQGNGMGMDITYHRAGRFKGITEFNASFDLGAALLGGEDYAVYASLIKNPK